MHPYVHVRESMRRCVSCSYAFAHLRLSMIIHMFACRCVLFVCVSVHAERSLFREPMDICSCAQT